MSRSRWKRGKKKRRKLRKKAIKGGERRKK